MLGPILARVVIVDPQVLQFGRVRFEERGEWALTMLLACDGDARAALAAVRRSTEEVVEQLDGESSPNPGEFSAGEWDCMRVSDGVLIGVFDCEDLPLVMSVLVERLEAHGVSGVIGVWDRSAVPSLSSGRASFLACRVCVRGERVREAPRRYEWQPDPAAHASLLEAAERWCRSLPGCHASVQASVLPPVRLERDEPATDRLRDTFIAGDAARIVATYEADFRLCEVRPFSGRVVLAAGTTDERPLRWREALTELIALLREHAELLAYAHIRRGWSVDALFYGDVLANDWPARDPQQPSGLGVTPTAFDDLLAPDVFGVQLLGPDYRSRVRPAPDWRVSPLATGRVLLEHEHPERWYAAPFVVPRALASAPHLLTDARATFADLLYRPGALMSLGYVDLSDSTARE